MSQLRVTASTSVWPSPPRLRNYTPLRSVWWATSNAPLCCSCRRATWSILRLSSTPGAIGARVLCLEEVLGVGAVGDWQLLSPAEHLLRDFRHDVVGNVRFGMPEHRFPTPPGSSWSDVTIRFINGHEVEPRVRGQGGGVFNYAHMGMAKTNRDEPTVQWDLLRVLAEGRGELPWPQNRRTQNGAEAAGATSESPTRFLWDRCQSLR